MEVEFKTPYSYFLKKEKEMKMFCLQYRNISYWQLVRFGLLKNITVKDLYLVGRSRGRNYKSEVLGVIKESKRMQSAYKSMQRTDIIRIRPCVTVTKSGKIDDHQFDYVDFDNKYKVSDLYALGDYTNIDPCVEYDLARAEKKVTLWKIKRKIFGEKKLPDDQRRQIKAFLDDVNSHYGMSFDLDAIEYQIFYQIVCHKNYVEEFRRIFSAACPKLIMVYPHYDDHMFAAVDAARSMGIKSVEMQHGRINAHEAYWYEDQKPEGKILPDYFFTYGEWWNQSITLPDFFKPIAVGNPYLEKQLYLYPRRCNDKNRVMIVFSNPQNGKVLSEFMYGLKDYIINNNISVLYKMHPNERGVWKEEYPYLSKMPNTRIIDDNTSNYSLLAQSNIAIGINSTLFYEALVYDGISLYIYTIGDYEGMKPLIENGMATAVTSPESMIKCLNEGKKEAEDIGRSRYWKDKAEENIISTVADIIGN